MLTVFHGWRRKMGATTLAMAALLIGPWIRSMVIEDFVMQWGHGPAENYFASGAGSIQWITLTEISDRPNIFEVPGWRWESRRLPDHAPETSPISQVRQEDIRRIDAVVWVRKAIGFEFAVIEYTVRKKERFRRGQWIIPYWSITMPVTLLSAYLLLSKPRPKPNQTVDAPNSKTTFPTR